MKKKLVISMHPAPYRDPVMSLLNEVDDFDVLNLYSSDRGHPEWNYAKKEKKEIIYKRFPIIGDIHFGLVRYCKKYNLILIPGYYPVSLCLLIIYSVFNKKKIVFSCDTIKSKFSIFHRVIYMFIKKSAAFFVPGNCTKKFLVTRLGISSKVIFQGSYMLDNLLLFNKIKEKKENKRNIFSKYNIESQRYIFLFVGKFVSNRNIPLLLKSYELACNKYFFEIKPLLVIIGSGNLYNDEIKSFCSKYPDSLLHIPSVSFEDLIDFYAIASCYVHPGKEPYSLATVQAVLAEIPVVTSHMVGAVDDYVISDFNGYVIETNSKYDFAEKMFFAFSGKISSQNLLQQRKFAVECRNTQWASNQLLNALSI